LASDGRFYTADIITTHGLLEEGDNSIQKPFRLRYDGLCLEVLDSKPGSWQDSFNLFARSPFYGAKHVQIPL